MRKRGFYGAVLLLIIGLFLPALSFAETIILKSGKKIEGKIVERTDEYIKVDSGIGMALTYFFDMIESIEEAPSSASKDLSVPDAKIPPSNKQEQANTMCNTGLMLIKEGKREEGLKLIKQATEIAPEDPVLHMNYGSILFMKGQSVFESGNKQEGEAIFKEVEKELLLAIKLFKETDNMLKSQCSFLLGDVYFYAYNDKEKAKSLYEKALEYDPRHSGAINALNKVSGVEK